MYASERADFASFFEMHHLLCIYYARISKQLFVNSVEFYIIKKLTDFKKNSLIN